MYSLNNAESRKFSRSLDHVNWWTTEARNKPYQFRSGSSMSEDQEIRNGWLTLPDDFKARFQQRQMMEKEQKMVAMYEAQQARALTRVSGNTTAASAASALSDASARPQGKVRQMFEERRTKAGIDKSHPLQPIQSNSDRNPPRKPLPNGYIKVTLSKSKPAEKPATRPAAVNNNSHSIRKQKSDPALKGGGDVNHNTHINSTTTNNNTWGEHAERAETSDRLDGRASPERSRRLANLEDETFPEDMALPTTPRTPGSPPPRLAKPPPTERRSPAVSKSPSKPAARPLRAAAAPAQPRRTAHDNTVQGTNRSSPREHAAAAAAAAPVAPARGVMRSALQAQPSLPTSPHKGRAAHRGTTASSEDGATAGEPCSICGRKFASDRLQKHEDICRKSNTKRRKPYDALRHRLAGTEAEPFIKQIRKLPPPGKGAPAQAQSQSKSSSSTKPLNTTWRKKHEEFINAIRAAKEAQAYVAAGGKLSDLPPPPPSENPDYVSCPHCGRRFNQAAADRHIPQCQSYQFNKPKPQPARKR